MSSSSLEHTIKLVCEMPRDRDATELARAKGLSIHTHTLHCVTPTYLLAPLLLFPEYTIEALDRSNEMIARIDDHKGFV